METKKRFAHMEAAKKLQNDVLKLQYIRQEIQEEGSFKYLGCTNKRLGPPTTLPSKEKANWEAELKRVLIKCSENILVPFLEGNIESGKKNFTALIQEKLKFAEEEILKKQVMKGFRRAKNKWNKRNIQDELVVPESLVSFSNVDSMEIGTLRRGEVNIKQGRLIRYNRISKNKDVYKILAHSIYGSGRFRNFISRSVHKYMNAYGEVEKGNFYPHLGILSNGNNKWITSWHMFYALLSNRDLCFSSYELTLISKLYDVNISVFIKGKGDEFDCIWQTDRRCSRVINLLLSDVDEWSLLQFCSTWGNLGNVFEVGEVSKGSPISKEINIGDSNNQVDNWSTISDSVFSSITTDSENGVAYTLSHSIDKWGEREDKADNKESEWSVITSDSESKEELLEIERKVMNQGSYNSEDGHNKSVEKVNSSSNRKGLVRDDSIWSSQSDSSLELSSIEYKVNRQERVEENWLKYSMITISTIEDNEITDKHIGEDIVEEIKIDYTHSERVEEKRQVNDQPCSNVTSVDNPFYHRESERRDRNSLEYKTHKEVDSKENIDDTDRKQGKLDSVDSIRGGANSNSSIEEEVRWLFEEVVEEKDSRDSQSSEDTGSRDSRGSRDKYRQISNKIRRRKFWRKWKNKIRNKDRNQSRKQDKQLIKEGIKQKSIEAVFDYYSKGLDRIEIEFLSNGSTFCVASRKVDEDRFKADVYAYSRRLRLHEEFREQSWSQVFSQVLREQGDSQSSNNSSLGMNTQNCSKTNKTKGRKLPSTYDPDSQNRNLARYCNCIQEESLLAIKAKSKFKDNISIEHRKALNTLKKKVEDKEIVITLADKGSGIVVVDYDTYIDKGTKYIELEAKAYSETDKSHRQIVTDIVSQRNKIVKKLREHEVIEVETATYCMKQLEEKVTGMKFYYKIHKDSNIDTMPLRPLQSCIGSPTHHLSQVLTDLLQPYLSTEFIPTFIQDSNQLLYRLSKLNRLDNNSTLISSDVAALYPSIPHKEGLDAVKRFLADWSDYNSTQIKYIMLALELVITQNYVMWNGKIYSQDSGVAMGTPVAVAYANIFMDWIDRELRLKANYVIEHIRYIDDNLFIIPENKIEELMEVANTILAPYIRFTYEKLDRNSNVGLPFLDTQLFISSESKIDSRLYTKKTDRHTYLLPTSFHPSHITRNIPSAVFNRIRRICSRFEWFQADAMLAMQWLEDRGYKYIDIKRAVEKSSRKDRWEMIEKIEQNRIAKCNMVENKLKDIYEVPVIITYSQNAKSLKEVFKRRQELLDASFNQTKVRPRLAFRRQKNINDILIQKSLRKPILGNVVEDKTLEQCGIKHKYRTQCPCKGSHDQQLCRCCAHLKIKLDNVTVNLFRKISCESKNVIYVLGCKICHKLYVGETQQQLKDRFIQHLNNINKLSQPLYIHFRQVHKAENIFISVLEAVRSGDHTFRKIREAWWINKLQTLEPRGFNIKLECSQIYQASSTTIDIERVRSSRR